MTTLDGDTPLVRAVRWLTTIRTTLAVGTLLAVVFCLEVLVWEIAGFDAVEYWFVADTTPSPGWLLAAVAHSPLQPVHLPLNLALLVVYGGMAERRLTRLQYLAVLVAGGVGATGAQVLGYLIQAAASEGVLGASGAALSVTAFAVVESARRKLATGRWAGETTWIWTTFGAFVIGRRLVLDLALQVPGVGRYGHLWGVLFGVGVAAVVAVPTEPATSRSRDGKSR